MKPSPEKPLALAILFALALALHGAPALAAQNAAPRKAAPAPQDDVAWTLALDRSVPGKGGWTTCYEYATGLQRRLTMAGVANHVVIYNWNVPALGLQGCHAFVVYQDGAGRYWGVDNLSDRPRWLHGTTPPEWAAFWDADKTVQVLADLTPKARKPRTHRKTILAQADGAARTLAD